MTRKNGHPYTKAERDTWEALYESGMSIPKIAKKLKVPARTIYRHFHTHDLELREIDTEAMKDPEGTILLDGYVLTPEEALRRKLIYVFHRVYGENATYGAVNYE